MAEEKMSFEEAVKRLEEGSEALRSGRLSLEESLKTYEDCVRYYGICKDMIENARQKIEIYRPDSGEVEDFDEA
ncbi:MAG: exodeoxyribonuclease VII small subunit [Firmicutes bacterium]|nr:exodeoxyribonuclease VII small subunit [Bacillota bacterium]